MEGHPFLKSKIQIGNSKGPIQYGPAQSVFHHDDVPENKRLRKEEVLQWASSKILDPNRSAWNKSNDPNNPVCVRRQMENHVKDRSHQFAYNYRAETVDSLRNLEPVDKSTKFHISVQLESTAKNIVEQKKKNRVLNGQLHRTKEMPVHPNLENATWNTTTVLTKKELDSGLNNMTTRAKSWTGKVNMTLGHSNYVTPIESTIIFQEQVRQKKADGEFDWRVKLNRPKTPPEEIFETNNRYKNDPPVRIQTTEHSGTWGKSGVEQRDMWSDTGSYEYHSKGDRVRSVNLDRMNNANPVKGSRRLEASTVRMPIQHYSLKKTSTAGSTGGDDLNKTI